jgi:ferric-dicitrate binding protein FerR (iron transport regulator)
MQRLSNYFSEPVLKYEDEEIQVDNTLARVRPIYKKILWVSGIAASLLVGWFVLSGLPDKQDQKKASTQNTVITNTKRGSKSKIQLPDGTQVWLNSDSKITYNVQGVLREVHLSGEAFFDVARDETRPFVIHTNAIDVKVLGTVFNVRSYADEKNTETSLIHGSVEVTVRGNDKKFILEPNDKLIVQNNEMQLVSTKQEGIKTELKQPAVSYGKINYQKNDSSVIETLWVKDKLAFDGEALEDIALKIERWYDVEVIISNESLKKEPYTATFENFTLLEVMEALQLTGKFKYKINKKEVTIGR